MNGQAIYRFSTRVTADSVARLLEACGLTVADVDHYVAPSVEPPDHRHDRPAPRNPAGEGRAREHRALREHVERLDSARADRRDQAEAGSAGRHRAHDRRRGRAHVGLGAPPLDAGRRRRVKVAFCFPGQGSHEVGMGRAFAETLDRGERGLPRSVRGDRARSRAALLRGADRGADRDGDAAAGARGDIDRLPARGRGEPAFVPTSSSGIPSASTRPWRPAERWRTGDAVALVRERGLATAAAATSSLVP